MINTSQPQKVAHCAGMATQRAIIANSNATTGATANVTNSLKALAGAILERNSQRNINATETEKQRNFCTEKPLEKLRSVAADLPPEADDRHHCRTCQNSRNGFCAKQHFRPVDDIPRRCKDFAGLPKAEPRYFQFLITRLDGSQFISASVPFKTVKEIRIQFHDAAAISPVIGESS
jgi:hypothetical protein